MDHFGIGTAMRAVTSVYFQTARRTGRTKSMVESLKNGDRVVFADRREANRISVLCRHSGLDVECIVVPPATCELLMECNQSRGRTLFDHSWVEQFYMDAIARAQQDIHQFQVRLSAPDALPIEPQRQTYRWNA